MNLNIPIIIGTTRKNNQSQKVAKYLFGKLKLNSSVTASILDLGKADFPMMEERLGVWESPPELLEAWSQTLKNADAVIIVAPEYKNGYPGSLKNFLDFLPAGIFKYKPIGIATVSSGSYGGTNCLAQLRLVCLSLQGMPIPDRLQVSEVVNAFDDQGFFINKKQDLIAEKFLKELINYATTFNSL